MSLSGDIFTIPSPFDFPKDDIDDEERFKQFGTKGKRGDKTPQRKKQRGADRPDRRIPIMNFTENDDKDSVLRQGAFFKDDELDPHRDLQYLGECMVGKFSSPFITALTQFRCRRRGFCKCRLSGRTILLLAGPVP